MARRGEVGQFEDIEIYPAERSASKDNAHYHLCMEIGERTSYASCLDLINQRKDGRLSKNYAACSVAIGKKLCPALQMQQDEQKEGQALYFLNREKLRAFYQAAQDLVAPLIKTIFAKPPAKAPIRKPVAPVEPATEEDGYAAAINRAMTTPSEDDTTMSVAAPKNTEGLSPLQIARLRTQEKVSHE